MKVIVEVLSIEIEEHKFRKLEIGFVVGSCF